MPHDKPFKLERACAELGIRESVVLECIQREWVVPGEELDAEDVARLRLIVELRRDFGVNDEGVEVILHLVDQLHAMRALLREKRSA